MNKESNAFIVLMGLPSSGKSTIARLLSKELTDKYRFLNIVIGSDDMRRLLPSQLEQFDPNKEPFIKNLTINIIQFCLKNNYIVINDDINYYKSMRHELKQIAEENNAHFILIHIQIPLKTALKWNKKRGLPVPQGVIQKVYDRLDHPGEYQWDIPLLTIQPDKISPESALKKILSKLIPIIKSPFKSRITYSPTKSSRSQKIDKITRKIIANFAQKEKNPNILKKISKFRKNYIKKFQITKISVDTVEKDFLKKLKEFVFQLKQAK
ncbi:MAG: AAA family ATPase [Promethearchaeota archaeon]